MLSLCTTSATGLHEGVKFISDLSVKQEERFLEQLRAAKEPLRPPAGHDTSVNIPPKKAAAVSQRNAVKD